MGNFKKNPDKPFEVPVPNKIRKRIAMHEKRGSFLKKLESSTKKRGSMWSRFTNQIKKFLK